MKPGHGRYARKRNILINKAHVAAEAKGIADIIGQIRDAKANGAKDPFAGVVLPPPRVKRKAKRATIKEADIVRQCLQFLKKKNIFAWRQNTGTFALADRYISFGKRGAADITGILPDGRRLEIECKRPKAKQTEKQQEFQIQIEANNGVYWLIHSVEELIEKCQ